MCCKTSFTFYWAARLCLPLLSLCIVAAMKLSKPVYRLGNYLGPLVQCRLWLERLVPCLRQEVLPYHLQPHQVLPEVEPTEKPRERNPLPLKAPRVR